MDALASAFETDPLLSHCKNLMEFCEHTHAREEAFRAASAAAAAPTAPSSAPLERSVVGIGLRDSEEIAAVSQCHVLLLLRALVVESVVVVVAVVDVCLCVRGRWGVLLSVAISLCR